MPNIKSKSGKKQKNKMLRSHFVPTDTRLTKAQQREMLRKAIESRKANGG